MRRATADRLALVAVATLSIVVSCLLLSCATDEHPQTVCAEACDVGLEVCTDAGDVAGCYLGWEACAEHCEGL